ncbi:S-layer homology domain-containing protein [Sedimentibacter sp. zth1]|uniref:S-layer homology domain-containing protein n=1 Tax=Sedimentibacter sp. zth1 TaxID=2816908 RepID=UPI001A92C93A|nr:S-layer homology domain-containing protein [Sedimentibacter sp. zth1]QSX05383.1 S-layer homology domain-containing protein [Sedimentibacter sp. zth1]
MNIFTTHAKKVVTLTLIFMMLFTTLGYGNDYEYNEEEIEALIDKVCLERGVPSVFVKAIATLESGMQQFNKDGTPKISSRNNIGLMQVGNYKNMFDAEKLKYDIEYNINAGIDVLLIKWNASVLNKSVSSIGNMDPNVLENWYFALWAYNGWISRNNPNYNSKAYQNRIYKICDEEYEQPINNIELSCLPSYGNPSRGLNIETPSQVSYANTFQFEKDDIIVINSIIDDKYLCDEPDGQYLLSVSSGQIAKVTEGPILQDGNYWYKILINDNTSGWIERNWIKKIGDADYGIYPFEDIIYHWSAEPVMKLFNKGIINGKLDNKFHPDENLSREEFCVLLTKVLQLESSNFVQDDLRFEDKDSICAWAAPSIVALDKEKILNLYADKMNAELDITRGEITYIIAKHLINLEKIKFDLDYDDMDEEREFNISEAFNLEEIELSFKDIENLEQWQVDNIKILYSNGLISGATENEFEYSGKVSRGATASVMSKLFDLLNN